MLLKFYDTVNEAIRNFCKREKTEYFSNLKKMKPAPTVTVKEVTRKTKKAVLGSQPAFELINEASGSNSAENHPGGLDLFPDEDRLSQTQHQAPRLSKSSNGASKGFAQAIIEHTGSDGQVKTFI